MELTQKIQVILDDIGYKAKGKEQETKPHPPQEPHKPTGNLAEELIKSRILSAIFDYALKGNHSISNCSIFISVSKKPSGTFQTGSTNFFRNSPFLIF